MTLNAVKHACTEFDQDLHDFQTWHGSTWPSKRTKASKLEEEERKKMMKSRSGGMWWWKRRKRPDGQQRVDGSEGEDSNRWKKCWL